MLLVRMVLFRLGFTQNLKIETKFLWGETGLS